MRSPFKTFGVYGILLLAAATVSSSAKAQVPLKDFVLFGNTGVTLGSSTAVSDGKVGSNVLVQSTGTAFFGGNVHSFGQVRLANSNTVVGKIYVANATTPPGNPALQAGSNQDIRNTIDAKDNVVIGSGTVRGPVVNSGTYSGPPPTLGRTQGTPTWLDLPSLPSGTPTFSNGSRINGTAAVDPGVFYGDVTLKGGQTLTFNKPGAYYFNSIKNTGNINYFVFNFPTDGRFRIYVKNDVDLYKISVRSTGTISGLSTISDADLAARVLMQVYGNGSTSASKTDAFIMAGGASGSDKSTWIGTVSAPNGNITIGSGSSPAKAIGALWSGKKIVLESGVSIQYAAFLDCSATVNAGADKQIDCDNPTTQLTGSVSGKNPQYSWKRVGGTETYQNSPSITVSKAGTYVLSGTSEECTGLATDTVVVIGIPCVVPTTSSPATGKDTTKIGPYLTALHDNPGDIDSALFVLRDGYVLIDVIVKRDIDANPGNYATVKSMLLSSNYGMADTISNGPGSLIITGFYPIANLLKLNVDPIASLISFVQPTYPPLGNTGLIQTQGDSAIRTNLVRNGFHLSGQGVKVGVISDSWNTLPNNDIANGDLPSDIEEVLDYPYGAKSDEGRAMMQIIYDEAPNAKLAFRTGFITAGDMAQGIGELVGRGCKVIVDDITFITEPFFKPGVIANAIRQATSQGVNYVTAAGNFGVKSYEGTFYPSTASLPNGIQGVAHDFSRGTVPGGDIFQSDSVKGSDAQPGFYTLVLQWDNNTYSLGGNSGATSDLDTYVFDNLGNIIGFNRINIAGDPTEILTFKVTRNTIVNIMIVSATPPPAGLRIKYVGFRGDLKINEYNQGTSTIVGQANAPEAITVGAAFYGNTPAFGVNAITHSSFSSGGGTQYLGVPAQKPDLVGPNGVNTSVEFGSIDYEGDHRPNFFGTSAAAPHVAGAVALLVEARQKYYGDVLPPAQIKTVLKNFAIDMEAPGFDLNTGSGFIQADSALRSMANPTPQINGITLVDPSQNLGAQSTQVIVSGSYLTSGTKVVLGTDTLQSAITSSSTITTTIPAFDGTQNLYLYNNPKGTLSLDGGLSDPFVLNGVMKKTVTVKANDQVRKYGEKNPAFTNTILVNGAATTLSLVDLGLTDLNDSTEAVPFSNVGIYFVRPYKVFDSTGVDAPFLAKYNYVFTDGALTIQKMPLTISANNQTVNYGDALTNISFKYDYDATNIADNVQFLNTIKLIHQSNTPSNALAVVKDFSTLSSFDLTGMNMLTSFQALNHSRRFEVSGGKLVPGTSSGFNPYYIIDVASQSLSNYKSSPSNSPFIKAYPTLTGKAVFGLNALEQDATAVLSDGTLVKLVSGSIVQTLSTANGSLAPIFDSSLVQLINGTLVKFVNGEFVPFDDNTLVQWANGTLVKLVSGQIVPLTLDNDTYVKLSNGTLVKFVNNEVMQYVNGTLVKLVSGTLVKFVNNTYVQEVNGVDTPIPNGSLIQLDDGTLVQLLNGDLSDIPSSSLVKLSNGTLAKLVSSTQLASGTLVKLVSGTLVKFVNNEVVQVVNGVGTPGVNSKTAVIVDESDATPPAGWLGGMVGINMITSLDIGQQKLVPGVFINDNFDVIYGVGTITIQTDPCLLTHSKFTNFGSTTSAPTSMWLNVEVKVSGQLKNPGDYVSFTGGKIDFNGISSTPLVSNYSVPNGKIVADPSVSAPVTYFDLPNFTWITKVPLGFSSTSDIFISGAIINSTNGFIKKGNTYTVLKGIFLSNTSYSDQWSYALAAYQPQFTYTKLALAGSVVSINGNYRAGTPLPVIQYLVNGGSGGGGNNYSGSSSSMDNITACAASTTTTQRTYNISAGSMVNRAPVDGNNLKVNRLFAYPNPASQKLSVTYGVKSPGSVVLTIVDLYGRTMLVEQNNEPETGRTYERKVDVSRLAAGVYFVKMVTGGEVLIKKIIIAGQ